MRLFWLLLGLLSLALAYLGVFVPGLPTTVFVLVALYAFSRSSPRLDRWLRARKVFASSLHHADRYRETGTISAGVQRIAQIFAWSSVALTLTLTGVGLPLALVTTAAVACSLFMYRTKTPDQIDRESGTR